MWRNNLGNRLIIRIEISHKKNRPKTIRGGIRKVRNKRKVFLILLSLAACYSPATQGRSTIAAGDLRFPVRDGMERVIPRYGHQAKKNQKNLQTKEKKLKKLTTDCRVYQANRDISIS